MGGDKLERGGREKDKKGWYSENNISSGHPVRENQSSEDFWKTPQIRQSRQLVPPPSTSELPASLPLFHRWINLKFGYVVSMSVIHVLHGGDENGGAVGIEPSSRQEQPRSRSASANGIRRDGRDERLINFG
uniref:Uncharacterized protein n=1 Tax=Salix viminalis TaxID=40686 RepID=A0A6N2L931_SALVM